MNQEPTSSAFHGASCSAEMVERYIASIQQEHDLWNTFREQAMDRQQFALVARYGDVCDALKMAINQARKILLPNVPAVAPATLEHDSPKDVMAG